MERKRMEIFEAILESTPRKIEDEALADVIDALSWHPHVSFNLRDAAALLALAGRADPALGERMRSLARDALALAGAENVSAGRAALVGRVLKALIEGKPIDELEETSAGWEVADLARSLLERGLEDPQRLEAVIADLTAKRN